VLKAAKSVQGLPVEPRIVEEARTACRELHLIGKAKRRDRRSEIHGRDLKRYANLRPGKVRELSASNIQPVALHRDFFHFRDRYDNEVDIVMEDQRGYVVGIEVKAADGRRSDR
jgi:predicted AAA+ superfamily ATPase